MNTRILNERTVKDGNLSRKKEPLSDRRIFQVINDQTILLSLDQNTKKRDGEINFKTRNMKDNSLECKILLKLIQ
jgi:hypothetical protein